MNDKTSAVYQYKNGNNVTYKFIKISDYISEKDAQILEKNTIDRYKLSGWSIVNKMKAGNLGKGNVIYTKEYCSLIVGKYDTYNKLKEEYPKIVNAILRNNWYYLYDKFKDSPRIRKEEIEINGRVVYKRKKLINKKTNQ